MAVVALPAGFRTVDVTVGGIHVANVGDQLALFGSFGDDTVAQALILHTQTWQVLEQIPITAIPVLNEASAGLAPQYQWNTIEVY